MPRCATAHRAILMAFCGLFTATPVYADPEHKPKPAPSRPDQEAQLRHTMRDEINSGLVGIISEGTDYTVDLALVLAGGNDRLRLLPIAGTGAQQNAKDVIFARGVDFGIVQTDVLDEIKRNPPFPGVEKYLQYVTKLYDQELHLLAGPDIQTIGDLRGKKVNFGLRNSGTDVTAAAVFKALGVAPEAINLPQPLALDRLRRGEISALVYVATKPSRLFQDVRPEENLHFVPITGDVPSKYAPVALTSQDYPELVAKDAPVKTVAVGTVLIAYNWPDKSERRQRATNLVQAFFTHLKDIKARRPRWREFDVTASVSGWTRFPAAEQWLKRAELIPHSDKATAQQQTPLDPKTRDSLFLEFAERYLTPNAEKEMREALFQDFAEYVD